MRHFPRAVILLGALPVLAAAKDDLELKLPEKAGGPYRARATAPAGTEWMVVFYRLEGEEDFNSFNLDLQPDGTYTGEQDITTTPGVKVQYYAALRTSAGISYLPKEAPAKFAVLQVPGGATPPPAEVPPKAAGAPLGALQGAPPGTPPPAPGALPGAPPPGFGVPGARPGLPGVPGGTGPALAPGASPTPAGAPGRPGAPVPGPVPPLPPPSKPLTVDVAAEQLVHHEQEVPGEPKTQAAGQVRLYLQEDLPDGHFLLNARVVYTNQPFTDQPRWGLGEFQAILTSGRQKVQVGDTDAQESEFTLAGAGRRGFDYAYMGQPTTAHLFALNTQAQLNTRGVLWPVKDAGVFGGSLGESWFEGKVRTRLIFLSGKDDPSTAANAGYAFATTEREGSTGALVVDGRFMDSRLNLSGEYARSLYTPDVLLPVGKESDQAWRFSTLWNDGAFSAHAGYHDIGRDFGTVGVAYFVGDRRLFDGGLAWNRPGWSLNAMFMDERTNPTGQAGLNQAWNQTASLDARIGLSATAFWRFGVRGARQEADLVTDPLIPFSNSRRTGLVTGLDFVLPPASTLSFNAQFDRLTSTGGLDSSGSCTTLSFGGSLALGTRGRISPNLSWSRTLQEPGDQRTVVSNAFLNTELFLVQDTLVFTLNGGASRTQIPTGETLTTSSAEGTLRLLFDRWLGGRARAGFGVKGIVTHMPPTFGPANDNRVLLVLNVSL